MNTEDDGPSTTTEMEIVTSPLPQGKKKGRRSKKNKVQKQQLQCEGGEDVEMGGEEEKKVVVKRGRPKKSKIPKIVKIEPPESPSSKVNEAVETVPSPSSYLADTHLVEQIQNTSSDRQPQDPRIKVVKRRRVGGARRLSKKNASGGENLRLRSVVNTSSKNLVDVDDLTPDEIIYLDQLDGFENVEVFNASGMGSYKLDIQQETECNNMYAMPLGSMQYGVNFGMQQSVSLQFNTKAEPGSIY